MFSTAANSASGKNEAFEFQFDKLSKKSSWARTVGQITQILRRSCSAMVATRNGCAPSITWEKETGKLPAAISRSLYWIGSAAAASRRNSALFFPLEVVAEKCVNFNDPTG